MTRAFFRLLPPCLALLAAFHSGSALGAALGLVLDRQFQTGKLHVRKIELEQPHIIPEEFLKWLLQSYENRELSVEDILELQTKLSKYYFDAGYISSGIIIPDQEIEEGVLILQAVHGRLARIDNDGNQELSSKYINYHVAKGIGVPVNYYVLSDTLLVLQQHELIERINARLLPGKKVGESTLQLTTTERTPYIFAVEANNHQSPSIGSRRGQITLGHRNLFGKRDTLRLDGGATDGLKDYAVSYKLPVSLDDANVKAYHRYYDYTIVEEPAASADIESTTTVSGLSFSWPLAKKIKQKSDLTVTFEHSESRTLMFGEPASFSSGVGADGEARTTNVSLAYNWWRRDLRRGLAMSFALEKGIDALDATINDDLPDSDYLLATAQINYGHRMPSGTQALAFRLGAQVANDELLPVEKFSIGGVHTVRGYRENRHVRDNGVVASAEAHVATPDNKLVLVPFFDYGVSWKANWNEQDNQNLTLLGESRYKRLYSAGLGIHIKPNRHFRIEVYLAKALAEDSETSSDEAGGKDLQEEGIHFSARYEL